MTIPPYTGPQGDRALFTDARNYATCPRCGAAPGDPCQTPKGRRTPYPHDDRVGALVERPDYDRRHYQRTFTRQP